MYAQHNATQYDTTINKVRIDLNPQLVRAARATDVKVFTYTRDAGVKE